MFLVARGTRSIVRLKGTSPKMDFTVAGVRGDRARVGCNAGDRAPDSPYTVDAVVARARAKCGGCPLCGNQTCKTHKRTLLGRLLPLNIPGLVKNGKCTHPDCPGKRRTLNGQHVTTGNENTSHQQPLSPQTVQPIAPPPIVPIQPTVELSENDSIYTILTAMRENRRTASVQERGCAILGRLSQYGENNPKRTEIGLVGGIVRIVDGMELHPLDEAVQRHGCFALRYLVLCNDDNKRLIAQTWGGVETVITAMNNHGYDELLLEHACFVLWCLCWFCNEKKRKEADERRALIGKAGGIEAVTNAMRLHPTVVPLLKYACWALINLSSNNNDNKIRIAQAGGLELLLDTMQKHPTAEGLLEQACAALASLSSNNDNNRRRISKVGGIKVLVDTMEQNSMATNIQHHATWALYHLSLDSNNKSKIAQRAMKAVKAAQLCFPSLEYPPLVLERLGR